MTRHRRRSGQAGQSMLEMVFLVPVVLLLFLGVYTTAAFLNDRQIAGQSSRAGVRLAAEIGNAGYFTNAPLQFQCQKTSWDPCGVDAEIVRSTLTVARGFSNVPTISEVDIYEACWLQGATCQSSPNSQICSYDEYNSNNNHGDGSYKSGYPVDVYKPDNTGQFVLTQPNGATKFSLDLRSDVHPYETPVGVRIVYTFQGSAPMTFFNFSTSEYATMCMAPIQSGG